ncbi:helix-turn-helix domain-containing protein [Halobaculum limi]|uniref:helix-turn-helix domain-containing protein n=1 Tax=Halobaculum limi TaxID=3031916 RepID=UPI002405FD57|nr:helix-turn-helix domain-containing protein [Halobaculum sp. YSMS11]
MAPDDPTEDGVDSDRIGQESTRADLTEAAERLEEEASEFTQEVDERIVDLLSWLLDTETRARIYVYLRKHPASTSEEVADGTGLYPSTVREALAELHGEEMVTRTKREASGAGNNPYEYEAIEPANLVQGAIGDVQDQLNTVFNLDAQLSGDGGTDTDEPVRISVETAFDEDDR